MAASHKQVVHMVHRSEAMALQVQAHHAEAHHVATSQAVWRRKSLNPAASHAHATADAPASASASRPHPCDETQAEAEGGACTHTSPQNASTSGLAPASADGSPRSERSGVGSGASAARRGPSFARGGVGARATAMLRSLEARVDADKAKVRMHTP